MKGSALVVGGAGGVGLALVRQLAALGYRVSATVLDAAEAERVRAEVPGIADVIAVDLSDADRVAPALAGYFGSVDDLAGIFVCAAISPYGPLETTPLAALRRTIEINAIAGLAVFQAGLPALRRSRGRFLLISSFAGKLAMPLLGHYAASKFALEALVDVMRQEAAPAGVEVIAFEPGGIRTPMVSNQQATLRRDIAALSDAERAVYGDLYARFAALNAGAYDQGMPPEQVADVMIRALRTKQPKTRYEVGDQARQLCAMKRRLSDRAMDAAIGAFYASAQPQE